VYTPAITPEVKRRWITGGEGSLLFEVERDDDDGWNVDERQTEARDDAERETELTDAVGKRAGQAANAGYYSTHDGRPATSKPGR